MSGHSKWSTIKRKKGAADAKRGKIFTTLIKEIQVAARHGGSDESTNPRLRTAINTARGANMPNENIKKAILRGTGDLPGVTYDEISYEGYGPGGVAMFVECMTDNKQRTVADVRHLFSKYNGSLAENGAVSWIFNAVGVINVNADTIDEDALMEHVLESGAEDMTSEDGIFQVTCATKDLHDVQTYFDDNNIAYENAELVKLPSNTVKVESKDVKSLMKLMDGMEDCEDVQKVWANFEIDDELLENLEL